MRSLRWTIRAAVLLATLGWDQWGLAQSDPYLMADTVVTDCIGELTDSGGPDDPYGNNEDIVFTVLSSSPLDVSFIGSIDIEPAAPAGGLLFDYLVLHDGPNLAAPVLDTLYGSIPNPGTYVTSGSLTVHFVSDASAQPQGFHLAWTANPPPPLPPLAILSAPGACPYPALFLDLSFPIECALIDWNSLSISASNGQTWSVDTTSASLISCPGGTSDALTLPLADGETVDGNCTLALDLVLGVRDDCDSIHMLPVSAEWEALDCPVEPDVTHDVDTVCTGGCAWLEAVPRGCGPTDITWTASDGTTFAGNGPWEVCPTSTTTYTATATETETGTTGSTSVTITVLDLGAWVQDTTLCPGDVLQLGSGSLQGEWTGPGVSGPPWAFDAGDSGPGAHILTFTAFGTAACASDATVEVVDFSAPANVATCPESAPFTLPGQPATGAWSGLGVGPDGWTFDPSSVASPGQDTVITLTFEAAGCTANADIHIEPAAPPVAFGELCQSLDPIALPFDPPGGSWSGPGLSDDGDALVPDDTPAGPFVLTYAMEGCNRIATGILLPIQAGPTSTSCPEQEAFVPFPGFYPLDGTWTGPGIDPAESATGLYDPGLVADGQWSPLVYSAPNGCTDTLWMFNRQTTVDPAVVHACTSDTTNQLDAAVGFSPWCGQWNALGAGNVTDLGDCLWAARATDFPVGEHPLTYSVNTCTDTLLLVVHPDSLTLSDGVSCTLDDPVDLPILPLGAQWTGSGAVPPTDSTAWTWIPSLAGGGVHPLVWNSPAGCTDTVTFEVESPPEWAPEWAAPWCANSIPLAPPSPSIGAISSLNPEDAWLIDGTPWLGDTTSAALGAGSHTVSVSWTGSACSAAETWTVIVLPPLAVELTAGDETLCPSGATELNASIQGGLSADGNASFQWSDGGLPVLPRTVQPETTGWWGITVEDGCSDPASDSLLLSILPPFETDVVPGPLSCHGEATSLLLDALQPMGTWHILEGDTLGAGAQVVEAIAGTLISWTLVDSIEGCTLDTAILVPGHPPLTAAFSVTPSDDCIAWDAQPMVWIDLSSGAESGQWTWTPLQVEGGTAAADSIPWQPGTNPQLSVPAAGTWNVSLVVEQSAGCADTVSQTVCVLPQTNLWLPDAFSPNGDGANDRFRPRGSGVSGWRMTIHDAWGRLVWEESHAGLPSGSALQPTTENGFPIGWDGGDERVGLFAIRLEATTDGGTPVLIEQPLRLVR